MAEKIKKSLPWWLGISILMILAVVFLNIADFNSPTSEVKAAAATTSASGAVGNAAPTVSAVNITSASITLTENGTTSVTIAGTITDLNGGNDISSATATLYATSTNETCASDSNNCYVNISCTLGAAVGNDKNATCTTSVWFHANPGEWGAYLLGGDIANATSSATDTTPSTVNSLNAVMVSSSITYDTLSAGQNMASTTKMVNATTTGNAAIDLQIKGDDMASSSEHIDVTNERYATDTVAWASGNIASSTYVNFEVDLAKPTTHPSDAGDIIYWGWAVPGGALVGTYTGTLYFNPVSD